MRYYPLNIDIRNRKCLVVGGGNVGERKTASLIRCGASVTVISRDFTQGLSKMAESGNPVLLDKFYEAPDLEGTLLVFAATNDRTLNERIRKDAAEHGKLFNIADDTEGSSFIVPSVVERGDLVIAVSTSGKSPALARKLKHELESCFGPEYGAFLKMMGAARKKILAEGHDPESHRHLFRQAVDRNIPAMIKEGRYSDVYDAFREIFQWDAVEDVIGNLRDG